MFNQNIISNKFDLNLSTTLSSYTERHSSKRLSADRHTKNCSTDQIKMECHSFVCRPAKCRGGIKESSTGSIYNIHI
jgi:hypothetical protein